MTPHEETQPSSEKNAALSNFRWKPASHSLPSCPHIIAKCNGFASKKCSLQRNLHASFALAALHQVAKGAVSRVKQKTCIIYAQCLNVLTGADRNVREDGAAACGIVARLERFLVRPASKGEITGRAEPWSRPREDAGSRSASIPAASARQASP